MFPLVEIAQKIPVQPIRLCDEVLKSLSVRSASNDKDKLGSDRVCQNRYQDSNRDRNRDNEDDEYSLFFSSDDDSQCGAASDADRGDAMSLADLFQAENALNYFFDTTTSMCNAFRTKGRRKSKIESTLVAPVSPTLTASPLKRKESVIGFRPRSAMSDAASKGEMLPLGRRRSMYRSTRDLRQRMSRRASFVLSVKDDGQPNAEVFSDDVTERRSTPNYNSSRKASFARAASACRFGNSSRASKGAVSSATGKARKPSFDGTAGDRVWPTSTACFIDEESDNNTNSPKSGVAMNSSVDPSKELMLTEALQGLCQIYRSNAAADASARGTADLEAAKAKVLNCLLTITSETNTGHISLKSEECCGAVCDAVFLLVTGDGPLNRSQESKEPLEESILQHVELSCIAKQLMDKDFLLQCIFHDNGKAFDLAMKSVCVNHMLADNWKRLFNAICSSQCDKIVYLQSAIQGIKCITDKKLSQDVCSMFHGAVKSVLITESLSTHLNEALTLLETVKNQNCFSSGFWDAEGPDGQTLFSAACAAGKLDIVKKLWSLGVVDSLNKVQSNGTNGLMQAVINNQKSVVQWFCQQPANTTGESFRHVHAVYGSVLDVAKEVDGALYTMLEAHVGTLGGS
uniref:WGS project CAEQ00000000 data, annotated contig 1169 n=1 Tax=Trypanosoma congolense (strain IL3000) TaxID=1068625 RepID=F9W4C8_TRYCI|nr:unnamed protein product [Trypanosoma congolense IL3000]